MIQHRQRAARTVRCSPKLQTLYAHIESRTADSTRVLPREAEEDLPRSRIGQGIRQHALEPNARYIGGPQELTGGQAMRGEGAKSDRLWWRHLSQAP